MVCPSDDVYKRLLGGVSEADMLANTSNRDMELTWNADIQSKKCYMYDYFHDDQPHLVEGMNYTQTTKTPIDAKFIVTTYGSVSKDQVEFHLMFRPSQRVFFCLYDDLYYFEIDYRNRYGTDFPIGLYIDIPDERGVYHKWIICEKEYGNQFTKYSVLPCNYYAMWIENEGDKRIKRKIWCVTRDYMMDDSDGTKFTYAQSQSSIWFPLNKITERLLYNQSHKEPKRLIVSALTSTPLVWRVDSISNADPIGIYKVTLKQDEWNTETDYVNLETKEMFADYYSSGITPIQPEPVSRAIHCEITTANNTIKAGGSYKLLTVNLYDENNKDITEDYLNSFDVNNWSFFVNNISVKNLISIKTLDEPNKIRIRFADDKAYLSSILTVIFEITINNGIIYDDLQLEITAL